MKEETSQVDGGSYILGKVTTFSLTANPLKNFQDSGIIRSTLLARSFWWRYGAWHLGIKTGIRRLVKRPSHDNRSDEGWHEAAGVEMARLHAAGVKRVEWIEFGARGISDARQVFRTVGGWWWLNRNSDPERAVGLRWEVEQLGSRCTGLVMLATDLSQDLEKRDGACLAAR